MFERGRGRVESAPPQLQGGTGDADAAIVAPLPLPRVRRTAALRDERGFTLVELMVTILLGLIIFAAVMQMMVVGGHRQKQIDTRISQLQSARVSEEALARDLRQATAVTVQTTRSVQYTLPTGVVVTWACTAAGVCTRTSGAGVATKVMSQVTNSTIFALPSPNYVTISFVVSEAGRSDITINDGVALRNLATTTS